MTIRSTEERINQPPAQEHEVYVPPRVLLKHMSMALRVTSEWNRRLTNGVHSFKFWQQEQNSFRGGGQQQHTPVNVHPSRPWQNPIPITLNRQEKDELTLFHAKELRKLSNGEQLMKGVARWGPELLPYLEHIVDLMGISPGGVEIPLAMIYLDRACSVETSRSNGVPPVPFCTPRTVHRLTLASIMLATQAVKGTSNLEMMEFYEKLSSLGIPENQLEQMVEWMRESLGDSGLTVTIPQMREWGHHWESTFFSKQYREAIQLQQMVQPPMQQQNVEKARLQDTESYCDSTLKSENSEPPRISQIQNDPQSFIYRP